MIKMRIECIFIAFIALKHDSKNCSIDVLGPGIVLSSLNSCYLILTQNQHLKEEFSILKKMHWVKICV